MEAEQFNLLLSALEKIGSGTFPWAAVVSGGSIFGAALFLWWWQRQVARRALTFQTIQRLMWDGDYIEQRKIFVGIEHQAKKFNAKPEEFLRRLAQSDRDDDGTAQAVRIILNDYENLSIAINKKVLDERMLKDYHRSAWLNDFGKKEPFILELREGRGYKKAFIEFEAICKKWGYTPKDELETGRIDELEASKNEEPEFDTVASSETQ